MSSTYSHQVNTDMYNIQSVHNIVLQASPTPISVHPLNLSCCLPFYPSPRQHLSLILNVTSENEVIGD